MCGLSKLTDHSPVRSAKSTNILKPAVHEHKSPVAWK